MKYLIAVLLLIGGGLVLSEEVKAPEWKGLVCMTWIKPTAKAVTDGDTPGEEMVINIQLTTVERKRLYLARQASRAAFANEESIEQEIISNHGYKVEGSTKSVGPCGEFIMIRADEYHITQFIPSNPAYPGTGQYSNFIMQSKSKTADECRAYFANLRKKAVTATYGVVEKP